MQSGEQISSLRRSTTSPPVKQTNKIAINPKRVEEKGNPAGLCQVADEQRETRAILRKAATKSA